MLIRRLLIVASLTSTIAALPSNLVAQKEGSTETFTQAVMEIQHALAQAQVEVRVPSTPVLKKATVTLRTTVSTKVAPGVQIVVGASGERQDVRTEEIELTLTPRDMAVGAISPTPLSEELVEAIKTAYSAARSATEAAIFLEVSEVQVHLALVAKKHVEGGVSFEVPSVKVGVEGAASEASVHGITLLFKG